MMIFSKNKIRKTVGVLMLITMLFACHTGNHNKKKSCIEVDVVRNSKVVRVDSCFTASTSDSVEKMIAAYRLKQSDLSQLQEAKLFFVIVDTLNKKPDEYEYGLVVSDAGIINPDVILTNDPSLVKEKTASFAKENIILKKCRIGESVQRCVETVFKTNVRINYRREDKGTVKINPGDNPYKINK